MPTTTYTTPTMGASVIGARTDSAGAAVTDTTAEEARFPAVFLTEGYLTPATSFKVAAQTVPDMTVKVGSGVSKADYYVITGEVAGQGNYIARLDVTSQNVTIDASDASQTRTDEIYLVVRDNPYDASSRALPQLGYRKGDLGGANPGVDSAWRASVILARIVVGAAVTTITNANITDLRAASGGTGIPLSLLDAKGDLVVATANDTAARLGVGSNDQVLTADSAQSTGVKWATPISNIPLSIIDAKGDLIGGTAADTAARLAVGSNGQGLIADSAQSTGLKWSYGMELLSETLIASPTSSVTLSSIPQTHRDLLLVIFGVQDESTVANIGIRFNGDTGNNYDTQRLEGANTVVGAARDNGRSYCEAGVMGPDNIGSSASANECLIPYYTSTAHYKMIISRSSFMETTNALKLWLATGRWKNASAITSITLDPDSISYFDSGTRIALYGIG